MPKVLKYFFSKKEIYLFAVFFVFSAALMFKTFKVSSEGNLMLATKLWSDFAATIPLIRSFSFGSNFPPQYPIFAGPPIRYHFLFYLLVGTLEKLGLPLGWALNIPSFLSFFGLLMIIYFFAKYLFKSKVVATLSVIFFLFNGSFSFLEFFKKYPLSAGTFSQIIRNTDFPSFGPYDGKIVSAFWNLNIYTNQRHLALAYFLFFLILFLVYQGYLHPKKFTYKRVVLIGIVVGLFPFLHLAVFGMLGIMLLTSLLIFPKIRTRIFLAGTIALILAIPQILYMGSSYIETKLFHPGYLIEKLTLINFIKYWFLNLGIVSILAPIGVYLANKSQRRVFIIFLTLFVIGNTFKFSAEIAANHKFFNLFIIGANMFTALLLIKLWKNKLPVKILTGTLFFFMILSGIIDLFPIINDRFITLPDIPQNKTANFILENTPKKSVFLNESFLYDPASLAGRYIYMGWPYFSWSAGYDTNERDEEIRNFLDPHDKTLLCDKLLKNGIDYIEISDRDTLGDYIVNHDFFENNFVKIFKDQSSSVSIYDVKGSCLNRKF